MKRSFICKSAPKPEFGSEQGICVFGQAVPGGNPRLKLTIQNGSPTETLGDDTLWDSLVFGPGDSIDF
jgi:hypothetical protein